MNDRTDESLEPAPVGSPAARFAGKLRVYIGAAPGGGKTYTVLREANALYMRGIDVVIGYLDTHGRPETQAQIGDLEIVPRKKIVYRHREFEEMDVDAILHRMPQVVVVDELAHSNVPGSRFLKRYMDVQYLLSQGIDVLCAVNVQHIETVAQEAQTIIGVRVREIIPKSFLQCAQEIQVIDVTPETLRQRLRDGSIYPKEKVEQALTHFFRKTNLSALRELALREVAENVDERLQMSFERSNIPGPVGARETILVCAGYLARLEKLLQTGKRVAERMKAELIVLTIVEAPAADLTPKAQARLEEIRQLVCDYEAQHLVVVRNDRNIGEIILEEAAKHNVTQVVVGQPSKNRSWWIWKDNPVRYLLNHMQYFDLRIVGWKDWTWLDRNSQAPADEHSLPRPFGTRIGRLTIYVGAAPGVGKTYKMLQDANDWKAKGKNVLIGLIETHGRADTAAQIGSLEILPKRHICFEGRTYEELDVDGIVMRKPDVVLIDELAHTNVPGSLREKRYQDIEYLLQQGINVVTAVNIQHLESLRDKVEHITGIKVRERVPDGFMDLAHEVKLVDVSPETLQQRLLQGKIYNEDKIQRALDHFFRFSNLSALREIALLEVADDVDQRLGRQRQTENGELERIEPSAQESILVCVNYRPHSEKLIRRGWRIADRHQAQLYVLVVSLDDRLTQEEQRDLERIQNLSQQFQAKFVMKSGAGRGVGATIVQMATQLPVSQIVIGQSPSSRLVLYRWKMSPVDYVLQHAEFVDLHVVANARDDRS